MFILGFLTAIVFYFLMRLIFKVKKPKESYPYTRRYMNVNDRSGRTPLPKRPPAPPAPPPRKYNPELSSYRSGQVGAPTKPSEPDNTLINTVAMGMLLSSLSSDSGSSCDSSSSNSDSSSGGCD